MADLYEFSADTLAGKPLALNQYRGKVVLVVNTASQCGMTPQYAGLEELHRKFHDRGLEVLGFPCNQFGAQEPGNAAEIGEFCQKNYGVSFQMFDKVDVNGPDAHPLYRWLTGTEAIKWNFSKFLLGRDGKLIARYPSQTSPKDLEGEIEKQLAAK